MREINPNVNLTKQQLADKMNAYAEMLSCISAKLHMMAAAECLSKDEHREISEISYGIYAHMSALEGYAKEFKD